MQVGGEVAAVDAVLGEAQNDLCDCLFSSRVCLN